MEFHQYCSHLFDDTAIYGDNSAFSHDKKKDFVHIYILVTSICMTSTVA